MQRYCPINADGSDAGFTLVETLVALFIFALITSASAFVLTGTLESKTIVEAQAEKLTNLQLARAIMKADLLQVSIRPVRDRFGGQTNIGFAGGFTFRDESILSFVRRGFLNPAGLASRGSSQHVVYYVRNNQLVRQTNARLDPTAETPKAERVLFDGVKSLNIRFLVNGIWVDEWRASTYDANQLPSAVSLTLDLEDYGPVRQLFAMSGERP